MRLVRRAIWTSGEPVSFSWSLKRLIISFLVSGVKTTFNTSFVLRYGLIRTYGLRPNWNNGILEKWDSFLLEIYFDTNKINDKVP